MMQYILDNIKARLAHWADWSIRNREALGYPKISLLELVRQSGGHFDMQKGYQVCLEDPVAEEMESIMCELRVCKPEYATVICEHYLERGTVKQKCKRLNMCFNKYKERLNLAEHWIAGRCTNLSIKAEQNNKGERAG